jgi:hypothetical protein
VQAVACAAGDGLQHFDPRDRALRRGGGSRVPVRGAGAEAGAGHPLRKARTGAAADQRRRVEGGADPDLGGERVPPSGIPIYQDFLYDDLGAAGCNTYPTDPDYARNAADLVELRIRPLRTATAIRLTYNTLIEPKLTATTIALGSSQNSGPGPARRERADAGPGVRHGPRLGRRRGRRGDRRQAEGDAPRNGGPVASAGLCARAVPRVRHPGPDRSPGRRDGALGSSLEAVPAATGRSARRQDARRRRARESDGVLQRRIPLRRAVERVVEYQAPVRRAGER